MNPEYKDRGNLINQKIKVLFGIYRDAIKHLAISESEFWIWYTLVTTDEAYTQQDICSIWSLPKQTVNTVITHMRIKKLAYLEAIPGTRNRKLIRLTEEGRRHGEAIVLPVTQSEEKALAKISPKELAAVTEIFDKYVNIIRTEFNESLSPSLK